MDKFNNKDVKLITAVLPYVYREAYHAFSKGCGKKTMMYWFAEHTGIYFNPKVLRNVILEHSVTTKKRGKYWTFECYW